MTTAIHADADCETRGRELTQLAGWSAVAGGADALVGLRAAAVEALGTADGLTAVLGLGVALATQLHGAGLHLHLEDKQKHGQARAGMPGQ